MKVVYTPEHKSEYTVHEEFTAVWEEGPRKYRLNIRNGVFEICRWNSGAYEYSEHLGYHPSVEKVLEAVEKYNSRLDITP